MKLKNAKVLLTGGSLGIGKATAALLIEKGAQVAITGRNENRLMSAAKEIGAFPIIADVSLEEDIDRTYKTFMDKYGNLDLLVNNAGLARGSGTLLELKREDMEFVYGINVFGAAMMAQRAARIFVDQDHGNIVNIASTAALKGFPGGSNYAASKFALRGMTQCWQAELRKHNVRVMLVNPSEVTTAFGNTEGIERDDVSNKLRSVEIAHAIVSALEMDDRGFIPELTVWATNPF